MQQGRAVSDAGLMRVRCRCCLQSNSAGSYSCVASNAVQANRGTSIPTTSAACAVSTAGFIAWQCAGPEDPWCMLPLEWLLSGLTHIASTTTCNIIHNCHLRWSARKQASAASAEALRAPESLRAVCRVHVHEKRVVHMPVAFRYGGADIRVCMRRSSFCLCATILALCGTVPSGCRQAARM